MPLKSIVDRGDRVIEFSNFVVPGFLGLVFGTRRLESGKQETHAEVEIRNSAGETLEVATRKVLLFRPLLKPSPPPNTPVSVGFSDNQPPTLNPPLRITNIGDGTALVFVQLIDSPGSKISHPKRLGEFFERYRTDLVKGLRELAKAYPDFSRVLLGYAVVIESNVPPTAGVMREIQRLNRGLKQAVTKSEDFLEALVSTTSKAFFANLKVVTEMHSFLEYLNSIGTGRVIIMNSLDSLQIQEGSSVVKFRLHMIDVAWGSYPPVVLDPVLLTSERACEIPVYALFSWSPTFESPAHD